MELGPYAYRQKMTKTNLKFSEDETGLDFKVKRRYDFAPELSAGSDSDLVVVPNVPLFGAFKAMQTESGFAKAIFEDILSSYDFANDTGPFVKVSVRDFVWGYPSVVLSMGEQLKTV